MKKVIVIYEHKSGNHSINQIRWYGREIFRGTATEARKELKRMVKNLKDIWRGKNTILSQRDFIADEMSEIFAIDIKANKWFYW